tara:strand:- start:511 stop:678 length:168 start_codon:yes stop_codon:yes gene_type:complete
MKNKKMIKIEVLIPEPLNQVISDDMEITGRNKSEIIRSVLSSAYHIELGRLRRKI